jgi:hypothetical protein
MLIGDKVSQKGTIGQITRAGKTEDCVYVIWQTRDPVNTWYVNIQVNGKLARCKLLSLIDRRPHEINNGFTQDAWSFEIIDDKTFYKIASGGLPIPPRDL